MMRDFSKHEWYRQGADASIFFSSVPYSTAFKFFGEDDVVVTFEGHHSKGYWTKESIYKKAKEITYLQKKDKAHIDLWLDNWNAIEKEKESFIASVGDLRKASPKELAVILKKFFDIDVRQWVSALYSEVFDSHDEELLLEEIEKKDIGMNKLDFKTLLRQIEIPLNVEIELKLLKAYMSEDTKDEIKNIHSDYYFIRNDWRHVEVIDESVFFDMMEKYAKQDIDKRISEIENFIQRRKEENEIIIKKYNLPQEIINLFYFFQRLTRFRDDRKISVQKKNIFLHMIAKRAEEIYGISYEDIHFISPLELISLFEGKNKEELLSQIKERKEFVFYTVEDGKMVFRIGEEGKKLNEKLLEAFSSQFKDLSGVIANHGKVKGIVKVVLGKEHFGNFNEGDVLVAPMTRPEFVPLMEKASAIVTDEGGVTSHAAILSRELGIPCIIGTQNATDVLADGELVEVDADKGIVRIIKKDDNT